MKYIYYIHNSIHPVLALSSVCDTSPPYTNPLPLFLPLLLLLCQPSPLLLLLLFLPPSLLLPLTCCCCCCPHLSPSALITVRQHSFVPLVTCHHPLLCYWLLE